MTEVKLQKSQISVSSVHKYHKSRSELIWPFYGLLQLCEEKFQKSHISRSSVHKYHKSCSQIIWLFYGFLQLYEEKLQKSNISGSSVHKYHKSCSQIIWLFYGLFQLYEIKLQKSHISSEFSTASITNPVLKLNLTVLRLLTTVWRRNFKKSHISVSWVYNGITKRVLELIWLFYGLLTTVWGKTSKISYFRAVQCTSTTIRVLGSIDCFTASYNCMRKNFQNLISPWVQCTSITNRVLKLIWPPFRLITTMYEVKLSKILISPWNSDAQVSQVVFWAHLIRFTAYFNYMKKTFKRLISPWVQCTSITNRVLRSFDRFPA